MLVYLLKVSLIWLIFLGLYETVFRNGRNFEANRWYLLLALLAGVFLPLIRFTMPVSVRPGLDVQFWQESTPAFSSQNAIPEGELSISPGQMLWGIYLLGVGALFLLWTRELVQIFRHAIYGRFRLWHGIRIFHSNRPHSPYSFMGWVFIYRPEQYSDRELLYILRHEAAHVKHRHGLDLILLQCICILFWFHPLAWRYRYLVKLVHEYQADAYASKGAISQYGQFLLQQIMMKGAPSIAHSFYFSPVKNRIKMLTSLKNPIRGNWKYVAVLPALLACTFFLARAEGPMRTQSENLTTYKGNTFRWSGVKIDSIQVIDPVSGEQLFMTKEHPSVIIEANGVLVYTMLELDRPALNRDANTSAINDLIQAILQQRAEIPDSIVHIQLRNVVLSPKGQIVYYEAFFSTDRNEPAGKWYSSDPVLDPMLDEIVEDSEAWKPALKDGNPVYEFNAELFTLSI